MQKLFDFINGLHIDYSSPGLWVLLAFIVFWALAFEPVKSAFITATDEYKTSVKDKIIAAENTLHAAQLELSNNQARAIMIEEKINDLLQYAKEESERIKMNTREQSLELVENYERNADAMIQVLEHNTIDNLINKAVIATMDYSRQHIINHRAV